MPVTTLIAQTQYATGFTVPDGGVQGNSIQYDWSTMPGNQPQTNANAVFLWQTRAQMIPSTAPQSTQPVGSNAEDGSDSFSGLTVTTESYLIGYGVGADVANICATVFIPTLGGGDPVPQEPSVSLGVMGPTSLSFLYALPQGTNPAANGDWAGLWEGQGESALYSLPPTWSVPINSAQPSDNGAFTNIALKRNTVYTVGYFKGGYSKTKPKQTTLACSTTFNT
jgi:hypothetical protein